jgi:transcriptional regulator with XRE-family HTH domain
MSVKTADPIDRFVGTRIKTARVMAGLSQEKLGEALGVTFQQVQKYEKGTNRVGASRMARIALSVGKPVSWFYDEQLADGQKAGTDIVSQMISLPGGLALAQSFVAFKANTTRHQVADLAKTLAQAGA